MHFSDGLLQPTHTPFLIAMPHVLHGSHPQVWHMETSFIPGSGNRMPYTVLLAAGLRNRLPSEVRIVVCPNLRPVFVLWFGRRYFPETSATVFRMFSEVMSDVPYKVFVFPVRESSTTTEGVPGTLNFVTRVLKCCMPAITSA